MHAIQDKQVVNQLVIIAQQLAQSQSTPTIPTSLFAPGTIAGDLQTVLAAQYNQAVKTYNPANPGNRDAWINAQNNVLDANQHFSDIVANSNIGGVP